jgi:DNA-binding transcriptional MerR regulator
VTGRTARRILRRQGMPPEEIRAVLAPGDPAIVRRLLELHRERLEEWLQEQRRLLASVEDSLAGQSPGWGGVAPARASAESSSARR